MGATNFQNSVNTIRLAIKEGYPINVVVKKLNTGSYKYITKAVNIPGNVVYYEVYKYENSGRLVGKALVDVSYYGTSYDNRYFNIPDSISKEILAFHRAVYN